MLFPLRKKKRLINVISDEASDRKLVVFTMGLDDQSGLLKSTDVAPWSASSTISDSGST